MSKERSKSPPASPEPPADAVEAEAAVLVPQRAEAVESADGSQLTALSRPEPPAAMTAPLEVGRRPLPFLPADADDMWRLATQLSKASVVPDALRGKPADAFVVLMTGREMGLAPMQSLHTLDVVHGVVFVRAKLRIALVLQSGLAEYFRCEQSDDKSSRWRTRRKDWGGSCGCSDMEWPIKRVGSKCGVCDREVVPRSMALTFTLEQAKSYGLMDKRGSGYQSKPAVMLRWRAGGQLADAVYPEIVLGMGTEDDLDATVAADEPAPPADDDTPGEGVAGLKAELGKRRPTRFTDGMS